GADRARAADRTRARRARRLLDARRDHAAWVARGERRGPAGGRASLMAVILVVDDSPVDRARAGGLLKKRPELTPAFASNGREALDLIASQPPDLVLTDLQMPEIDGLALVET